MLKTTGRRLLLILALLAVAGWTLSPKRGLDGSFRNAETGKLNWPLKLGLDLQGGMHLAIEISDPEGILSAEDRADAISRTLITIRNRIDEFGVTEPTIQRVGPDRIIVELAGIADPERAQAIVERTAFLEFRIVRDGQALRAALPRIDRRIVAEIGTEGLQPVDTVPTAASLDDLLGVRPDTVGAGEAAPDSADDPSAGDSNAADVDQVTGDDDQAVGDSAALDAADDDPLAQDGGTGEFRPLTSLLLESGAGGIFLVAEEDIPTVERYLALDAVKGALPRGSALVLGAPTITAGGAAYREIYDLEIEAILTGDQLADAGPAGRDPQFNQPIVPFETTRRGARAFERGTSRNVGNQMAIVLDGRVQSAPVIRGVLSRNAQIELGQASFAEAQDLALVLRAGALPQPIEVVEKRTVGPSLGKDSVDAGKMAFLIGIIAVVLVMIGYYKFAGVMAVVALGGYVVLVLGGLAGLGATLTLPGIAGLILSVGMAVDANVLIFERIREEIDGGKTSRAAVDAGFQHAMSAIVDANLTTLITAGILYQFGTGPVKGFAVTLSIGIIASFFTALFVTRTFFLMYLNRHAPNDPVSI
ncbi:MAG: protein translocase subunit SecD [Gemmatimonadota bacterium]